MVHLGDITKINGHDIPNVDVITGGSPCQDLSVAGKRRGLAGERSGLFMEQIRLIKELRNEADKRTVKPVRFMVWENVPGAFTSNKGEDFRCVLEETARIKDKDAAIPKPVKWTKAGAVVGDGWSLAWRVHDAQYWGVPQRRKRICLLADFDGDTAPRILFELRRIPNGGNKEQLDRDKGGQPRPEVQPVGKGMPGHLEPCRETGEGAAANAEGGADTAVICLNDQGGMIVLENHPQDSRIKVCGDGIVRGIHAKMGTGGGNVPMVLSWDGSPIFPTLTANNANGSQRMPDKGNFTAVVTTNVRRITPLEVTRLQGFPDGWIDIGEWTDQKGRKRRDADSLKYKALGNSIALPFWEWLAKRIRPYLGENPTMGSLFDGIGGFPLVFSRAGIKPMWASEIEEFPVAVTKKRFGE